MSDDRVSPGRRYGEPRTRVVATGRKQREQSSMRESRQILDIDPSEYDLDELRGDPGNGFVFPARNGDRSRADSVLRSEHHYELLLLQAAATEDALAKPYLTALPESYAGEVLTFEWLEFLLTKGGLKQTLDALRYYRTMEWITEPVENGLRDALNGINVGTPPGTATFDRSDHLLSLIYIARLVTV